MAIEQQQAERDEELGHDAAEQSLHRSKIQERPTDETVCSPDQPGDLNLVALGKDLQPNGVTQQSEIKST